MRCQAEGLATDHERPGYAGHLVRQGHCNHLDRLVFRHEALGPDVEGAFATSWGDLIRTDGLYYERYTDVPFTEDLALRSRRVSR